MPAQRHFHKPNQPATRFPSECTCGKHAIQRAHPSNLDATFRCLLSNTPHLRQSSSLKHATNESVSHIIEAYTIPKHAVDGATTWCPFPYVHLLHDERPISSSSKILTAIHDCSTYATNMPATPFPNTCTCGNHAIQRANPSNLHAAFRCLVSNRSHLREPYSLKHATNKAATRSPNTW